MFGWPHVLRGAFFLLKLQPMTKVNSESFDQKLFKSFLKTGFAGKKFVLQEQAISTNTYIKSLTVNETPHGFVCLTDNQTAGRGQYNRAWYSEPFKNLTFSVALRPPHTDRLPLLLQAMALSVKEAIHQNCELDSYIKWPNDVMFKEKKIAGILTESSFIGNELERFIIGVGINVNQEKFPINIKYYADSLINITGNTVLRERLLADICNLFSEHYMNWESESEELVRTVNKSYPETGKWVHLTIDDVQSPGLFKFLGLDYDGYPLFLSQNDTIVKYRQHNIRFSL
jgi:BirA family biotin operon repressor/biotin-[acetyl-CoA-carboxylase] ligase